MKKYIVGLLLMAVSLTFSHLSAQQIKGSVYALPDSTPLNGATVLLISMPDSGKSGAFTQSNGAFALAPDTKGTYLVTVKFVGFGQQQREVKWDNRTVDLGNIYLAEQAVQTNEVLIESERAMATQKGDTTVYNASAFTTNPDATAQNLLEKMPGIVVQNGQVQAQGEQVQQVLVDGKPFFGNDPNAALKNMPAEVIDKIQVFDQQSEQSQQTGFDDGQRTKTINIITKEAMRDGVFGRLYAGYGENDRFKAGGNLNYFNKDRRITLIYQGNNINQQNFSTEDLLGVVSANSNRNGRWGRRGGGGRPGSQQGDVSDFLINQTDGISETQAIGINYTDKFGKKLGVSGSYFYNFADNEAEQNLNQQFFAREGTGQNFTEDQLLGSQNQNHRLNVRFDYKPDKQTTLVFKPELSVQQNEGAENSFGVTTLADRSLNNNSLDKNADLNAVRSRNSLVYRRRFAKRGRSISSSVRFEYNENTGDNQLLSTLNYFTEPVSFDTLDQTSELKGDGVKLTANLRYTEPIKGSGMLQLSYSYSPEWQDSRQETFSFSPEDAGYTLLENDLSNTFSTQYTTHQAGAGYMLRDERAFLLARVSYQYATLENQTEFPFQAETSRQFHNVIPFVIFRYKFSSKKNFFAMYRPSTSSPQVEDLQEVVNNQNPLQLSTGNKDLGQQFTHRILARYNVTNTAKSSVFFAFINAQYTQDFVGQSTIIASTDTALSNGIVLQRGAQFSRPENMEGNWRVNSFITYGRPINPIKTNLNLNFNMDYSRLPSRINDQINFANTATAGVGVVLSSNISEKVDFTLSSQTNASQVRNSLQSSQDTEYLSQLSKLRLNLIFWKGLVFRSELTHQLYEGLGDGFNQNFFLWNMGLAKKLFNNQRGEIELSVFDALTENTSIERTVAANYIQDLQTTVLQRYIMLTFTWQIRKFRSSQ
ncbi:MAG: outer membrane beta-barrel protein [Bacteroidota bacterium]